MLIIASVLMTAAILFIAIRKAKRANKEELADVNNKYSKALQDFHNSKNELGEMRKGYELYVKKKEEEVKANEQAYAIYQEDSVSFESSDYERSIMCSNIVSHFHDCATKAEIPTEKEWREFESMMKESLPEFCGKISNAGFSLDKREIRVCMLIRMCFIPSEITILLNLSKQSVTNLRSKINKKLFGVDGAKMLDDRIKLL